MIDSRASCPYVGPRPFEADDRAVFFGRDREIDELVSLLVAHRAVLLYAESGAGKTSILNAGLVSELEREGFDVWPPARVFGRLPADADLRTIPNPYLANALLSWGMEEDEVLRSSGLDLEAGLQRLGVVGEGDQAEPRVLIFDQFEELFTSYPHNWKDRRTLVEQIGGVLEANPLLRVLLVIREDFIAQLTPFQDLLPEQLRVRYRLERLRKKAALEAVSGPLSGTGQTFAEGVAEQLVADLLTLREESEAGESLVVEGEFVEPVQLQVVCQELWEQLPAGTEVITAEHVEKFGDADQALAAFYEQRIAAVGRESRVPTRKLRRWFENALVTPAGTRGTTFRGQTKTGGLANRAVDLLEDSHLIRREKRAGARWYELTHDRFIAPIRSSNAAWFRRRRRRWLAVLVPMVVLCFAVAVGLFVVPPSGHAPRVGFVYVSMDDGAAARAYTDLVDQILGEYATMEHMAISVARARYWDRDPRVYNYVYQALDEAFEGAPLEAVPCSLLFGIENMSPYELDLIDATLTVERATFLNVCFAYGWSDWPVVPLYDIEIDPDQIGNTLRYSFPEELAIGPKESLALSLRLKNSPEAGSVDGVGLYRVRMGVTLSDGTRLETAPMLIAVPTVVYAFLYGSDVEPIVGSTDSKPEDNYCWLMNRGEAEDLIEAAAADNKSPLVLAIEDVLQGPLMEPITERAPATEEPTAEDED